MLLGSQSLVVALQLQLLRGNEYSCFNSERLNLLRDPHKLLPHIIHTLSDRPVSSTTELSTAKFALALADNIAYLY